MDSKGPIFSANSPSTLPDTSFPVIQSPEYASRSKKSKNTKFIVIIGAVIAIILIVVLVVKGNNSGNSDAENKIKLTIYLNEYNNLLAAHKNIEEKTESISQGKRNALFPVSKENLSSYESTIKYLSENNNDYRSQISKLLSSDDQEYLDIQNQNIKAIINNINFLKILYDGFISPIEKYLNNESSSMECKSIEQASFSSAQKQAIDSFENILCTASENWLERDDLDVLEKKINASKDIIFQAHLDLLDALQNVEYEKDKSDIIKEYIDEIKI